MSGIKNVIREFLSQLDRHVPAVDIFVHPDCKVFLPGNDGAVDREHFRTFVEMLYAAFPDLQHTILEQICERDSVATLLTVRGTHRGEFLRISPTGKEIVFIDILITRIHKGKIIQVHGQFDALTVLTTLGALRPRNGDIASKAT
jgi:predicted ester cyclase